MGSVVAIPADGLTVYRLVVNDPPTAADFRPQSLERAALAGASEILRLGLSHFLRYEDAVQARARPSSLIAEVRLEPHRGIHIARTGRRRGHVTVWARPSAVVDAARVVRA
jgi:hypothetical protein